MEKQCAIFEELKDFKGREANQKLVYDGMIEEGFGWVGQIIGLIHDVPTVQELLDRMELESREQHLQRSHKVFE